MNCKMLIIDESTTNLLLNANFEGDWFNTYEIPKKFNSKIKKVTLGGNTFLLSNEADENSRLLFINQENIFDNIDESKIASIFIRILSMALVKFGQMSFPAKAWRKHSFDDYISIGSGYRDNNKETRLIFHKSLLENSHVYMFMHDFEAIDSIVSFEHFEEKFIESFIEYENALTCEPENIEVKEDNNFGLELTETISNYYGSQHSIQHWYENILTREQRTFVDKGYESPVRLKGAAGTGKTLALAAKIIKDAYYFEEQNVEKDLLFLTHSSVNAQLVTDIIRSMDNKELYSKFKYVNISVYSLYDYAQELLNYNLKRLKPVSGDGREGRKFQYELLEKVLDDALKFLPFAKGTLSKCSERFKNLILTKEKRNSFILEVLNEFSCVLDSDNIYLGSENSQKYMNGHREKWLMELESEHERKAILELHFRYQEDLRSLGALSMDQMIADLNRYLSSHEWKYRRNESGYDAVFIDELHCFTKPERMVFHELFKSSAISSNNKYPLFMAYDINQATDDRFLYSIREDNAPTLVKSTKVGATELVELTTVFRYTPNIGRFLNHIDGTVPALGLSDQWRTTPQPDNACSEGLKPKLIKFSRDQDLVDYVFHNAERTAAKSPGKSVAVLCINPTLFDFYSNSLGRIRGKFEKISSRDDVLKINSIKRKCIFSMPEYVAGLQFDIVYLIHLDRNEIENSNDNYSGEYRRFISQVYLGASRSQTELIMATSSERRGPADILVSAESQGIIDSSEYS